MTENCEMMSISRNVKVEPGVAETGDEARTLFKGIPDDITVYHIFTKLPWRAMFPISRVSKTWRRVVKSRQLYNARVSRGCTQTLVPVMHRAPMCSTRVYVIEEERFQNYSMSLYNPVMESWNILPPVPPLLDGIPEGCGCVCLNSKVYVIGGLHSSHKELFEVGCFRQSSDDHNKNSRKEVYSLDLAAGDTQWTKCADMTCPRAWFHSAVNDGNIHVFWGEKGWRGTRDTGKDFQVQVYNPEKDSWDAVDTPQLPERVKSNMVAKLASSIIGGGIHIKTAFNTVLSKIIKYK